MTTFLSCKVIGYIPLPEAVSEHSMQIKSSPASAYQSNQSPYERAHQISRINLRKLQMWLKHTYKIGKGFFLTDDSQASK